VTARNPVLTAEITERFAEEAPLAEPCIVDVPPVAGAALLGLDRIGAPPAAYARLRDAYRAADRIGAPPAAHARLRDAYRGAAGRS
jgi:hypothetical protein